MKKHLYPIKQDSNSEESIGASSDSDTLNSVIDNGNGDGDGTCGNVKNVKNMIDKFPMRKNTNKCLPSRQSSNKTQGWLNKKTNLRST